MKARSVRRLGLLGVATGMVAAVGLSVGLADGGIDDLLLAGRTTSAAPGGKVGTTGPPIVIMPDADKRARRVPVPGATKTPVPAEPTPGTGGGVIGGAAGARIFTGTSAVSTEDAKTAVARCPKGSRVYGGGGRVNPAGGGESATGDLMLNTLVPSADPDGFDSFVATANRRVVKDQAIPARFDWSLEAFAVCGPELPGYEHVSAKEVAVDQRVSASAVCPAGKRVVGAGGGMGDELGMFSLDQMSPDADGTAVTVSGVDDTTDGVRPNLRTVLAIAVCAVPTGDYEVVTPASAGQDDPTLREATASCRDGRFMYGVGFSKVDDTGHAIVTSLTPRREAGRPDSMRVTSPDSGRPADEGITLAATAICAD